MNASNDTRLDPRGFRGLSPAEARARLALDGPNELPRGKRRGATALAREALSEPMVLLLLATGGIYLLLGEQRDAFVLLLSIVGVLAITFVQGRRAEKALERLRDMASPRARVLRDGVQARVPGREVVRGDLLIVSEGDRVAADGILVWQSNLAADESLLTGESATVSKRAAAEPGRAAAPAESRVFSGTLVVSGQGLAEVTAIGAGTEIGRIGGALRTIAPEKSPLQVETGRIVRRIAAAGALVCVLIVAGYARSRGNLLEGLLAGLAVAMSVLPEEFPVVLTIFLALGAWRISRRRVLTRRIPAIEALGAATVLGVDKTGTLTVNRMAVTRLGVAGGIVDVSRAASLPEDLHALVEFAVLASQQTPFDPTEVAIREFGTRVLARTEHLHDDWELLREYPLSRELLAVAHAWTRRGGGDLVIAAKGAPEAISDLCHLGAGDREALLSRVEALARSGLRVLAVAGASYPPGALPAISHDFDFAPLGLVGLEDPVRPAVPAAVDECRGAGIRVVMITGDYPVTASRIAREIGLPDTVVTGEEMDASDDVALGALLRRASVFARVAPVQKLRIVMALKAAGEVVAMTGDGVNDAPALKAAHIGIAMGGRGSDVAREAASLVLLDDDFPSIVAAVALGRRIHDNLRKAMAYLVAVHVAIAGVALLPVLAGWPLLLVPVQIVFLELIIDPASSIAFEAEPPRRGLMRRPPRDPRESLLPRRTIVLAVLQGLGVLGVVVALYGAELARGLPAESARGSAFAALIVGNLGLILANRLSAKSVVGSLGTRNPALWAILGGGAATLALVFAVPFLRDVFRFSGVSTRGVVLGVAAGAASLLWLELVDLVRRRISRRETG